MRSRNGFTLMEVLIMLAVLLAVAVVTVPKFQTMVYQSREGRTKAHLADLRGALAIYYSDNFGLYPSDEGTADTRLQKTLVPQYIKAIPAVELSHLHARSMRTIQDRINDAGDWSYSMLNGLITVNCTHLDTKGQPISSW